MSQAVRIDNPTDYWTNVVEPDYQDFMADIASLRRAFHCAISLFHMCDWIYVTHKVAVDQLFQVADPRTGQTRAVSNG